MLSQFLTGGPGFLYYTDVIGLNDHKKKKGSLMKSPKILLSLSACVLAFSGTAIAQDDDHGLITVRTTTVKVGAGLEYQELQGKLAAARKAAGHKGVDVWQVIRGPAATFYSVTSADNHEEMGKPFDSGMSDTDWQRWLTRMSDIIVHSRLTTLRTHGELAFAVNPGSAPNMVMLRFSTLKPGTGGDHHEWLANSLVPAMKEGNAKAWSVSNVTMGDDVNTWISSTRLDSWEQMDGPGPFGHMSERARNNMLEDYTERLQSSRVEVIRHLPDLSY